NDIEARQDSRTVSLPHKKAQIVDSFLLRAPALPVATLALSRSGRARSLVRTPSVASALALAAPGLRGEAGERARRHYLARMAFRATPAGLLAGVAVGQLGERTRIETAGARAHLDV